MSWLLEPFGYHYMLNAMWVSALVGGVCAFLSCYLMLKGWSLIGDALSHSIVPGVAGAAVSAASGAASRKPGFARLDDAPVVLSRQVRAIVTGVSVCCISAIQPPEKVCSVQLPGCSARQTAEIR